MARGKGGSGSSSSLSSCEYCNEPLLLEGYNWESGRTDALFALQCIVVIVLLVCLGLVAKFKWTRQNGARDSVRSVGYTIATVSLIIYFIFVLVDTGLREAQTETVYLYQLTFIFRGLFWRVSELLILAVILRTITSTITSRLARAVKVVNIIALTLIGVLTVSAYGVTIAIIAYQLQDGFSQNSLSQRQSELSIAYESLYLATVLFAAVVALFVLIKERSKATFLMLLAVIPAILLRILLDLVSDSVYYSSYYGDGYYIYSYSTIVDLNWADLYVYSLATIVIFLGLASIAICRPEISNTTTYGSQQQKVESGNAGYGNAGYANPGYANPEYGNATHVPVYN